MNRYLTTLVIVLALMFSSSCSINFIQTPFPNSAGPPNTEFSMEGISTPDEVVTSDLQSLDTLTDATPDRAEMSGLMCAPFNFPDLEEPPKFPYVPPSKRNDDAYISELLVEHVNALSEYITQADETIRTAYTAYLETCR